jgi:hypothetical protein
MVLESSTKALNIQRCKKSSETKRCGGIERGFDRVGRMTKTIVGERMESKRSRGEMSREAIKGKVIELLKDNDFTEIFESEDLEVDGSAGAALKAVISEKAAEYADRAMRIAKKRGIKFGAAAVVIATRREK